MESDIKTLSDEELENNLNEILNEKERRQRLKDIPAQIQTLSSQYVAGGGNPDDLSLSTA